MTFPSVLSVTSTSFASSTTHNVAMPAVVNPGDLLLVFMVFDGFNLKDPGPTGWTLIGDVDDLTSGSPTRTGAYSRRADGTEGGTTVNFNTGAACTAAAQVWRISNGKQVVYAGEAWASSTTPNPGNNGSGAANEDSLWIAVMSVDNDSAGTITSYPANYTLNQTETNSVAASATNPTLGCAARQLRATSEDPGTFTVATGSWVAFTILVRPYVSFPPFQPTTPRVWRLQ